MDIFVNYNYIGTIVGVSNDGGQTFLMSGTFSNPGQYLIEINTSTDPDPVVDYDLGVSNFSSSAALFSFSLSFETVGGPYETTSSNYALTLSDLGNDGASAFPAGGQGEALVATESFFALAIGGPSFLSTTVGGVPVGAIGAPCLADPASSIVCNETANNVHDPALGLFVSEVTFNLGPTDSARFLATAAVGEVPEPSAAFLLAGGLGLIGWLRSRRQRTA